MRIECPGCEAAYEVPDGQIRPGRSVRCARCAVQWRPAGDPTEPPGLSAARAGAVTLRQNAAPAPATDIMTPSPDPDRSEPRAVPAVPEWSRVALGWRLGWAASLFVLAGFLASAAHWRTPIMQHWPPVIRLYTMLGAQPPRS